MMPQFASKWNLVKNYKNIALGIFIFSMGLFKKVVIADTFAIWATNGFDVTKTLNFMEAWATSLSYTFQLYFDFSGYTDMAIGAALLFNIKLPINFNSPYKALDIQDFWRRWHITLSRFLRDYIYIPLGGNRKGSFRTYTNLLATFILGGIWHGAGWTFIFWGFLHGMALAIHRFWKQLGFSMPKILAWFITFNFINIAWVFFRAKEWDDAIKVLNGMFRLNYFGIKNLLLDFIKYFIDVFKWVTSDDLSKTVLLIFMGLVLIWFPNTNYISLNFLKKSSWLYLVVLLILLSLVFMTSGINTEFLYFNF